jgi:CelD/BcsL family acetyltransferase involved in cellulose biosynthesis
MRADQVHDSLGHGVTGLYTVKVASTDQMLPALEADWNRLSRASEHPNVFTTYGWFQAWIRRFIEERSGSRVRPHVLVLKEGNAVAGIAPLIRRISSRLGFKVRKLEFATSSSDYNDLIVGRDQADLTTAAVDFLARSADQWELLDLRDLRGEGDAIARIEQALLRAGLHYRLFAEAERCLYFPIVAPWSETMKKKNLRFARRAFCGFREGPGEGWRVRIVENPEQEPELLDRLIAVEAQKRVDGKESMPCLGKYPEVFQSLFGELGPAGWITIVLVEWNDRIVGYRLLYRCGKRLWDYQTAYDHTFSRLSPGTILICAAIDYAFANGLEEFDFLRGVESYKLRWTTTCHQSYRLLIWNRRWVSRLSAFAYFKLHDSRCG